jgi:indolepyruvate ferredoxin oxidoreductase
MIRNHDLVFPGADTIRQRIDEVSRAERNVYLDALAIADGLLRHHMVANTVVIGAAYQAGALPLSAASITAAIELNGAAVAQNLAAFAWGRLAVAEPDTVRQALAAHATTTPQAGTVAGIVVDPSVERLLDGTRFAPEVHALVRVRANELRAFQDLGLAKRYIGFVQAVAEAEACAIPGESRLSQAVARYLFKLMAYKDEYEVARLYVDPRFNASVAEQFPEGGKVTYHLHPPLLRALGMKQKLKLGPWFRPAFQGLYAMRRLRGTPLDPFGYARVRRIERRLIGDYQARVHQELATLSPETYERAVALAELPDMIRGYEEIKLENVRRYREALKAHAVR